MQSALSYAHAAPAAPLEDRAFLGLRPYQREAVKGGLEKLRVHRSAVIVLPTGCGKTRTAAYLVRRARGRVLWLANRGELLDQGREALEAMTGEHVGVEQGPFRAGMERIVVASVQTVWQPRRLEKWDRDHFSLIVCDEAHHFVSPGFRRILAYYSGAKVLGLTATPIRADKLALGLEFEAEAFVYGMDAAQADGWLVPFTWRQVEIDSVDLSRLKTKEGDFSASDLEGAMMDEQSIHAIAKPLLEHADDRRTIVYSPGVAHAERLTEILNTYRAGSARLVHGKTDDDERKRSIRAHKGGEYQFLCNVGVFTEGYDDPGVRCIACARPTKSANLYTQIVGRGGRPILPPQRATAEGRREEIATSAKPDCLILDFTGNAGRHRDVLMTPVDILGGRYDEAVRKRAKKILAKDGGRVDDALREAQKQQEAADRRKREAARARIAVQVKYRVSDASPFGVFRTTDPGATGPLAVPASPQKLETLRKLRVDPPDGCTEAQANKLIRIAHMRRARGLANFRQLKTLRRYGVTNANIYFQTANRIIDAIARNGWRSLSPAQMGAILDRGRETGEEG